MKKGFTLIELVVVMGIFALIAGISSVGFFTTYAQSNLGAAEDVLMADLKTAQSRAMSGLGQNGASLPGWGLKITGSGEYKIFPGTTYDSSNTGNLATTLAQGVTISTTLPTSQIAFTRSSGEVVSFVNNQNTITLTSGNLSKIITLNAYGTITGQ